jgi:hypothetical protein
MNRRFGTVFCWNIVPGAAGGQDVQNAVEQTARVTSGSADVRLRWWEVLLDNCPGAHPKSPRRSKITGGSEHAHARERRFAAYEMRNRNTAYARVSRPGGGTGRGPAPPGRRVLG